MRLGVSSYAFTWAVGVSGSLPQTPWSALNLVEKAAQLGVSCVQIADNMPLDQFSSDQLAELIHFADSKNIALEVGMRGMRLNKMSSYLDIAVQCRSPLLRIVIDESGFEPGMDNVLGVLKEFAPELEQTGIVLAIENHDRFKASEFVHMIEATGSAHVAICLDCVNSLGAGEGLETVVERLAPFTVNLHVKEYSVARVWHKMGFVVEGCPLGQGMLNLDYVLSRLTPRCQSAILEQWTPPGETLEATLEKEDKWATESIDFLKNKIKDIYN